MSCKFSDYPPVIFHLSLAHLMPAIRTGDIETLKSLFDLYDPPDEKLRSQLYHFLCKSLLNKEQDIAKLLLECGADVNISMKGIKTPLHHAAEKGYTKVVSMLLQTGALVNAKDDHNETSLHCAVERGNPEIINLLLNKTADIEAKTKNGLTLLHLAIKILGQAQISKDNLDHKLESRCKF